ncbi:formate dehydrogenase accessory protein FdhE [Desulfovibrio sp. TomC]|uniref:formate dehydrogenase accessory protein FdhE n=1 Tax=Desulfovibrio sp. TomC TaxID=1562888 RepID=UPI00057448E5|nr:formate dehydrogenase accessory protein FdhE [Desulfovibrio sp. TomC]KHK04436.1 formate dehydrogenase formation protein FdhE [Desulfovibrio sp. TomC]
MPFDADNESKLLTKKLEALSKKTVLPASMLALVAATAKAQLAARASESVEIVPGMLEDIERVLRGAPMLARDAFPVDMVRMEALFDELSGFVRDNEAHLVQAMDGIAAARQSGELDLAKAVRQHLAGDDSFFAAFGERTPSAPRLLNFLVQAALAPRLAAVSEAVHAHFPVDRSWEFGQCPTCASPPLMARLVGKEGARHLTCSFCQLEYRARRLMCPYCGEEDAKKLEVFSAAEEPGYFVHVCLTCKCYIKTTDFREFDRASVPVLDDLESLTLDMAARGQGYNRPVLSAWGF